VSEGDFGLLGEGDPIGYLLDELKTLRILVKVLETCSDRPWSEWSFVADLIMFWRDLGHDLIARWHMENADPINGCPAPVPADFAIMSAKLAQRYVVEVATQHFDAETVAKLENIVRDAVITYYGAELVVEDGVLSDKLSDVLYNLANGRRVPADEEIVEALEDELVKRVEEKLS
jgi:hypothetical protein